LAGLCDIFQTFEDFKSVKDKQAHIQAVRRVLDEDETAQGKLEKTAM
jgi:hypothetical protein